MQPDLMDKVNQLFKMVVTRINQNVELARRLTQQEDDALAEIEKQFGIFIKRESEDLGLAIAKAAKRQK